MSGPRRSVEIIEVQNASSVAAIDTSDGPRAIIEAGLLDALASNGAAAHLSQLPDRLEEEDGAIARAAIRAASAFVR